MKRRRESRKRNRKENECRLRGKSVREGRERVGEEGRKCGSQLLVRVFFCLVGAQERALWGMEM